MKRFVLAWTVLTAFQLGQLSKTDAAAVVGHEWARITTLYFWTMGLSLLAGLVFMLWRWLPTAEGARPRC